MDRFTEGIHQLVASLAAGTATTLPLSDGSNGKHRLPEDYDAVLWRIGLSDGQLGQTAREHDDILRALADAKWREDMEDVENDVARKQHDAAEATAARDRLQERKESAEARLSGIETEQFESRGHFSAPIGWSYVIVGLLLFGADMPLSLRFVADAFDINAADDPIEAFLVAFGVAGVGFFFKLAADYLTGSTPVYERRKGWRFGLAAMLMAVTCGASLFTLWYVGEVRAVAKRNQLARTTVVKTRGTLANASAAKTAAEKAEEQQRLQQQRNEDAVIDRGFKLMAFTFPLVGAICVSVGLGRVQNGLLLRRLRNSASREAEAYQLKAAQASAATEELTTTIERKERIKTSRDEMYNLWRGIYLHGYLRGTCVPQSLTDGERIDHVVERMVARWLGMAARVQNRRLVDEAKT